MRYSSRPKVGIDLAPASFAHAPGTARHVAEQARALFSQSVPWDWVPLIESPDNPLAAEIAHLKPVLVSGRKVWTRATFSVGKAWKETGCVLGFATAYFTPAQNIPVVANFFDSNVFEHGQTWIDSGRRWNYYLIRALSMHALCRASRLFVNSSYCAGVIAAAFPSFAEKLKVVTLGVTAPRPVPAVASIWRPEKPFVLYVGVFSENKNQRRLIEAWGKLQATRPDWPALVLIGKCPSDYGEQFIFPAIRACPRPTEIVLPGIVPDDDLAWAYHHASFYVQPSIAEGFGIPVIEAMSYGLPVVCSSTTSLPETAGDAAIYFDPLDTGSIAGQCEKLAADPALRTSLKQKGDARWRKFDWSANAESVITSIDRLLGQR